MHRDGESVVGVGLTEDDALRNAVDKLLPSHLARRLLARHGIAADAGMVASPTALNAAPTPLDELAPSIARAPSITPAPSIARALSIARAPSIAPAPTELRAPVAATEALALSSIAEATPSPAMAHEAAPSPAPDGASPTPPAPEPSLAPPTPAVALVEAPAQPAAPVIEAEPAAAIASPEHAAPMVVARLDHDALDAPSLPAAGPANEAPGNAEQPASPRSPRVRTAEALETVERLLAAIEDRIGPLARMCADRQRLNMLVWICRARAVEESQPGAREVEHAVARVARRLTEIGKMFWPGSVRALQLSARPADVRREMHATWATESANWSEATRLAERLLEDHLTRSAELSLDEDGWADGAARTPRPADPDALFEEVDAELKAMLIPPGEVPNGRMGELGPIEFEALLNAARKLRWLRGAVRDDLAWGVSMGRLRRAVPGLGERAGRVRDALDHRAKPPASWAKVLGERDAEPASAPTESIADLEAALPKAREGKEALMAWLIRAFDVVNTPDLVGLLGPLRAEVAALGEDELNHADRRVRRRLRDLVKRIASTVPESSSRAKEPVPEPEEDAIIEEPLALHALDQLSARVREETKGRRALFVSNRDDPELGAKLTDLLGISITWCDGSLRRVQAACERIARGSYDLILSATGFQVHGVDTALARAAGAAGVPYVRVNRGRPVACVQAIAREFGLNSQTITQKASSAG